MHLSHHQNVSRYSCLGTIGSEEIYAVHDLCAARRRMASRRLGICHRQVIGYRVGGMPDGKTARIANFGAANRDDWQVMRINADNTQSGWTGHYKSVEDALNAVLQNGK